MSRRADRSRPELSRGRRRTITVALLVGTFLASIEVTVVAAAMPSIADQLGGFELYPWVYSAYLLSQTVTIPLYGRLADLYGRRVTYVGGVLLFLAGSALCGMATSMEALVASRALQGLGAGAVLPVTMTIFGDLYEVSVRTKLQGLFSIVWGVSSVAGPLAGGAIVEHWSWRWVFLLNLPFGLISAALVGALLREREPRRAEHRLDFGGAALLGGATLACLLALLPAEQRPLGLPAAVFVLLAAGLAVGFILQERRHPEPLMPLDLFRDRVQVAANASGVLLGVVLFGVISYATLYVVSILGGSPMSAGAMLIPLSFGWTGASIIAGRIVGRVGFQKLVRFGCAMIALGSTLGLVGVGTAIHLLGLLGLTLYGVGMGCTISSFTVSVQERVPAHRRGIATALTQFSRSIGGALGVATLGAVLFAVAGVNPKPGELANLDPETRAALDQGLFTVFAVVTAVAVAAAAVGAFLFPRVEEGLAKTGHR